MLLMTKSWGRPILSLSLFFKRMPRTSRMVTASANGLSGFDCQRGTSGAVSGLSDDLMDHPADRGQLGVVERLGRVVGRVIARVFAGREEEERESPRLRNGP